MRGKKHASKDSSEYDYEDSEYSPGGTRYEGDRIIKNKKRTKRLNKSGSRSPTKYLKETESFNRGKFSVGKKKRKLRKNENREESQKYGNSRNRKDPLDRLNRRT